MGRLLIAPSWWGELRAGKINDSQCSGNDCHAYLFIWAGALGFGMTWHYQRTTTGGGFRHSATGPKPTHLVLVCWFWFGEKQAYGGKSIPLSLPPTRPDQTRLDSAQRIAPNNCVREGTQRGGTERERERKRRSTDSLVRPASTFSWREIFRRRSFRRSQVAFARREQY